jgi:hypothetical protein
MRARWWSPIPSPKVDELRTMDRTKGLVLLLGVGLLVFFITREVYRPEASTEQVEATVLLERVRPVLKLVTVEGDFSEVITYSDAKRRLVRLDQGAPLEPQAGHPLVKARASVGYDLEGMGWTFDEATRTVRFTGMGKAQAPFTGARCEVLRPGGRRLRRLQRRRSHAHECPGQGSASEQSLPQSGLFRKAAEQQGEFLTDPEAPWWRTRGWTFVEETGTNGPTAPIKD